MTALYKLFSGNSFRKVGIGFVKCASGPRFVLLIKTSPKHKSGKVELVLIRLILEEESTVKFIKRSEYTFDLWSENVDMHFLLDNLTSYSPDPLFSLTCKLFSKLETLDTSIDSIYTI